MLSTVKLGSGDFTYQVDLNWETLPAGYTWRDVPAVATDDHDNVYAFNRGDHPMIVFDSDGNFIKSWGEGVFASAHGISRGPDNTLYCTDVADHTVRQFTLDGDLLLTIGVPGKPADAFSGDPFNRCTHTAVDPNTGDIYVSDGYANSRVHKYSPDGKLLFSWGAPGTGEGEFNCSHNIATDSQGYVYVADRENHRIQVFDSKGKYETMWSTVHRPCGLYISEDDTVYVAELGWGSGVERNVPNIGPRVTVMNTKGEILERLGEGYGLGDGQFLAPHSICLDSKGSIYVGEVAYTNGRGTGENPPEDIRTFQKLVRA